MKNMLTHLSTKLDVKFMKSEVCKEICEFTIKRIAERSQKDLFALEDRKFKLEAAIVYNTWADT
jgi:hypothetical protein